MRKLDLFIVNVPIQVNMPMTRAMPLLPDQLIITSLEILLLPLLQLLLKYPVLAGVRTQKEQKCYPVHHVTEHCNCPLGPSNASWEVTCSLIQRFTKYFVLAALAEGAEVEQRITREVSISGLRKVVTSNRTIYFPWMGRLSSTLRRSPQKTQWNRLQVN